jgi:4-hydroxybenzoate polyprenyltransferase
VASTTLAPERPGRVPWLFRAAWREITLSWRFIGHDRWASIIPGLMFVLAAALHSSAAPGSVVIRVFLGLLYFVLFIYGFTLTNQLVGEAEDRINKPFRPLVAGYCTRREASWRAGLVLTAFPLLGWALGVADWAITWEASYLLYNWAGLGRHWIPRDLIMGIGVFSQLAAAWELVTPLTGPALRWMITLAAAITVLVPIQDLRDMSGDVAVGRRTFPVAVGERAARIYLATGFAALPAILFFLLLRSSPAVWIVWPAGGALAVLNLTIAVRVLLLRTPEMDHKTYRKFEQWYSLILVLAVIVLNLHLCASLRTSVGTCGRGGRRVGIGAHDPAEGPRRYAY